MVDQVRLATKLSYDGGPRLGLNSGRADASWKEDNQCCFFARGKGTRVDRREQPSPLEEKEQGGLELEPRLHSPEVVSAPSFASQQPQIADELRPPPVPILSLHVYDYIVEAFEKRMT